MTEVGLIAELQQTVYRAIIIANRLLCMMMTIDANATSYLLKQKYRSKTNQSAELKNVVYFYY